MCWDNNEEEPARTLVDIYICYKILILNVFLLLLNIILVSGLYRHHLC